MALTDSSSSFSKKLKGAMFFPASLKVWWLAIRPKTLSAAVMPVLVGTALATMVQGKGSLSFLLFFFTLFSALFIQIATNLINDALDFEKGVDTEDRIGPLRVTQKGLLCSKAVLRGGQIFLLLALLCGIPLVLKGGGPIFVLGLLSLIFAYLYTGGPYPLAYLGLGEIFVFLFFGLGAVGGSYYIQTLDFNFFVLLAGGQMGLLCTVILAINNLRDREEDKKAGKKTLTVRLGVQASRFKISCFVLLSFLLGGGWLWKGTIRGALFPLLALPLGLFILFQIYKRPPSVFYNLLLAQSSLLYVLFGTLLSLAFLNS